MLHWKEDVPRILVVDDSEEQVRFLRRLLKAEGYRCEWIFDGTHAIAACAGGAVDIVLLDVHLPGVDGLTVCRQLKAAPETCLIPVLVMTGVGGLTVRVKVLVPVPPALVALKVTLEVAAVVGVPEMRPVPVLTESPAGSPVAL